MSARPPLITNLSALDLVPSINGQKPLITAAPHLHRPGVTTFTPAVPPLPDFSTSLVSVSGLLEMNIPKRPRLLGDWLCHADLGYVFAPRGCGKTWLVLGILAAVSQGKALGAWAAGDRPVRTLYLDGEMPLELLKFRARGLGLDRGQVTFLHHDVYFSKKESTMNIGRREDREALTEVLMDNEFSMLILDNLSSLASGIDENKGLEYEGIADWLLELRRRQITVIIVHHAGRNGMMRGHSKREDACSWILQLTEAKAEGDHGAKFLSHFAKASRNTGEPQPDLLWHFTSDEAGKVQIACTEAVATEFDAFIAHVRDGVDTAADIAELMGKPRGTLSKWVKRAEREGLITRKGNRLLPADDPFNEPEKEDDDWP